MEDVTEHRSNDSTWHPVVQMINSLGCKSKNKVYMAMHVYLNLSQVKAMWDTEAVYNPKLDLIYIIGKWSKDAETREIVVPLSATTSLSLDWLTEIQNELSGDEEKDAITLAFVDGDSSICYYQACRGLNQPDSPETVQKRRKEEERKQFRVYEMFQQVQEMVCSAFVSDSDQD